MTKFVVVLSDHPGEGNPTGEALARFLKVYVGREVRVVTPRELLVGPTIDAEHLFLALPTTFDESHASRLRWRRLVLLDYYDEPEPVWKESDRVFLSSLTNCYGKTQVVEGFDTGFRTGMLPLAFSPKLSREHHRVFGRTWRRRFSLPGKGERIWDAAFLGSATYLEKKEKGGDPLRYHQRVDWLREMRGRADFRFWGGLLELPYCTGADLEEECGSVSELMWSGKPLRFREFFSKLAQTKVSLAPTGHARWTYRHIESVYAGCEVVSCDLAGVRTLIPLPLFSFERVPDHEPVAPVVERILAHWAGRAELREAAKEHLERYLLGGRYDARRPDLFEFFMSQWEG